MATTTGLPLMTSINPAAKAETAADKCRRQGGKWDFKTQTCIMPKSEAKTTEPEQKQKDLSKLPTRTVTSREGVSAIQTPEETRRLQEEAAFRKSLGEMPSAAEALAAKEQQQAQEQAIAAERQRLIEEETPERRELQTEAGFLEGIPILGGAIAAGRTIIGEPIKKALGIETFQGRELSPDDLRTAALTEIEKQEIERGLTANEKFGAFVEAIPVVGTLASKYAGGLLETPSGNTQEVVTNIRKERRRISNIETNVKLGYLPVTTAQEQVADIEENVQRLESRLKLLINNSPNLRFNSDGVNTIETEVLTAREKIFQAKQNILTGQTNDPTELQILQQSLLDVDDVEEFKL